MNRWIVVVALAPGGCTEVKVIEDETGGAAQVPCSVQEIFTNSCAVSGSCHAEGAPQVSLAEGSTAVLDSTSPQSGLPFIDFGNTQGSYLALKLLPEPPMGDRMPASPYMITEEERGILLGWVAGAELPPCGGGTGTDTAADSSSGSETGPTMMLCGWEDVPETVPASSGVVAGMGATDIPPDIGLVLENNCGCHLVETPFKAGYSFPAPSFPKFHTLAAFQEVPMFYTDPLHALALARVEMPGMVGEMPPPPCDLGDGNRMAEADRMLLLAWLTAMAPSGADWVPP
jgi:hypothetical protein